MLPCGISLFVGAALRATSILKNLDFLFVDVAVRAASILKNSVFLFSFTFLCIAKLLHLVGFEPRQYARSVSFEKYCRMHESTSQMDVWSPSYEYISCMIRVPQSSRV